MQSTKTKLKSIFAIAIAAILLSGLVTIVQPTAIKAQEVTTSETSSTLDVTADDIQRGNTQTIHIQSDSPGSIIGILTYPSGHQVFLQGNTNEQGALDYSFKIGGNTKPGTFTVDILAATDAGRASGSTTFEVSPKGALIPPTEPGAPTPEVPAPVENDTTTAPEEPIVIVDQNETTTVTPDNATEGGIETPIINDTTVVIPSNETTVPEPTTNDTEVIVAPENETEIVTGDNASEVPQVPDEIVDQIEDPVVVVPGNETEVTENVTVSEPLPEDLTPQENETSAGNVTDIVVVPPSQNVTETIPAEELPPELSNITEGMPALNETAEETEPGQNITVGEAENITITEPGAENITITEPENATITEPAEENVTEELPFLPENETAEPEIGFNETTEEPVPFPPMNETETPPATNVTVESPTEGGNVTVETPESNVTVTEPEAPTTPNGTTPVSNITAETPPEEVIEAVDNSSDTIEEALDEGNADDIQAAMVDSINKIAVAAQVVQTASDDERADIEESVSRLNDLVKDAFNELTEEE